MLYKVTKQKQEKCFMAREVEKDAHSPSIPKSGR